MKKVSTTVLFLFLIHFSSFATWSIIIIDQKTKEIGIAGASCTSNCSGIGSIIPGTGVVIVQAMSNYNAHSMAKNAIIAGHPLEGIMEALRNPRFDPEHQQYALVTLNHMTPLTYTGDSTVAYKGSITGNGISVQGNILADANELKAIFDAVIEARKQSKSIQESLMLALEAGANAGGDKRCGEQKAQSAFIKVAKAEDKPDNLYLNIVITGQEKGGENAVSILRKEYEKWKMTK
jgi:uncharacterized Ntn-hydrolase superfamily protein